MKLYKNAKTTIRYKVEYAAYRYEFTCPFCKTKFQNYSMGSNVIMSKCGHCGNRIIFEDEK